MQSAERLAERQSISKIEQYKKKEKHINIEIQNRRVESSGGEGEHDEYYAAQRSRLTELVVELKGDLLDIEMAL